jgi:hypothetical protein
MSPRHKLHVQVGGTGSGDTKVEVILENGERVDISRALRSVRVEHVAGKLATAFLEVSPCVSMDARIAVELDKLLCVSSAPITEAR